MLRCRHGSIVRDTSSVFFVPSLTPVVLRKHKRPGAERLEHSRRGNMPSSRKRVELGEELGIAAKNGRLSTVKKLLAQGADKEIPTEVMGMMMTPLNAAAFTNNVSQGAHTPAEIDLKLEAIPVCTTTKPRRNALVSFQTGAVCFLTSYTFSDMYVPSLSLVVLVYCIAFFIVCLTTRNHINDWRALYSPLTLRRRVS